jgi:hypothetical protein
MWVMSTYLVVLSMDHVLIRPRELEPDTVGYSVGFSSRLATSAAATALLACHYLPPCTSATHCHSQLCDGIAWPPYRDPCPRSGKRR